MASFTLSGLQIPDTIVQGMVSAANDESVVSKLSASTPQTMMPSQYNRWSLDPEAEFVGEGAQKSPSDFGVTPVVAVNHKAQITVRMSQEVRWADEDARIGLIDGLQDKMGSAIGRALDYGIIHAVSPLQGTVVSGMTALASTAKQVTATADTLSDFDGLADSIIEAGYVPDGIALSPAYANTLRKLRNDEGIRMFPEVSLNPRELGNLDGLKAAVSSTVNGKKINPAPARPLLALLGDYEMVKWGLVRELGLEFIEYGDPDGLGDLKRNNEIALRMEAMFSWAVLDVNAFAALVTA